MNNGTQRLYGAGIITLMLSIGCTTKIDLGDSDSGEEATSQTDSNEDSSGDTTAASEGCGQDPTDVATSMNIGGEDRSFVLALPDTYDNNQAYPLIFAWHGLGGSGSLAQYYFGLEAAAGNDAIIAYPNALPRADSGGETGWELSPYGYDFEFFDAMVDELTGHLCIDEDRIFSTGHSFGGYMSNAMGCYRGGIHNAIAPVAGGPPYYGDCTQAVGAWITHGKGDDTVELSQGEDAVARWKYTNECDDTTTPTGANNCVGYDGCTRDVQWCEHSGGHEWPGFAGGAIWEFFAAQ